MTKPIIFGVSSGASTGTSGTGASGSTTNSATVNGGTSMMTR